MDLVRVVTGLMGAWRLVWLDRSGLILMDRGRAGALASFQAALFVLPIWALIRWDVVATAVAFNGPVQPVLVEGLGYVIRWAIMPVLILLLADLTGRGARGAIAVTAYNWGQLLIALVVGPLLVLTALGVPAGYLGTFLFMWLIASFVYIWWVLKAALGIDGYLAAAFVVVDFIASQMLTMVIDRAMVS